MSVEGAYRLRQRWDGAAFANAWEAALGQAIDRLSDAALSRALHGVATPVFYKGEQIGERRKFDEPLTRFLLRCRAPDRYSGWTNNKEVQTTDAQADWFDEARQALVDEAIGGRSIDAGREENGAGNGDDSLDSGGDGS